MRPAWLAVPLVLVSSQPALAKDLTVRGTVRDAGSRAPVAGAIVTASGNRNRADEITDDQGFFRLMLPDLTAGALFRLRVEKSGYAVYDRQVVSSEEIPLDVALAPLSTPGGTSKNKPGKGPPSSPVVRGLLGQLDSSDPEIRQAAIVGLAQRERTDKAIEKAIVRALGDPSRGVRDAALSAVFQLKIASPEAVTAVSLMLNDPNFILRRFAAETLGEMGPRAAAAIPELLIALDAPQGDTRRAAFASLLRIGPSSRRPLMRTVAHMEPELRLRTVLLWMDTDRGAKDDVLKAVPRAELVTALEKTLDSVELAPILLPDHNIAGDVVGADAVRAAAALLLLDIGPVDRAWAVVRKALVGEDWHPVPYILDLLPSLPHGRGRDAVPDIVHSLEGCPAVAGHEAPLCDERYVATDDLLVTSLGKIGDAATMAALQPLANHRDDRVRTIAARAIREIGARLPPLHDR